jgi:dTDP-4-amino-4,6-dideoxygalactose transaminase
MDAILKLAGKYGLEVIEDAAHALPAKYKGKMVGTIGEITAFSFYATKNITTGEGGMVATNNSEYAERIRIMSLHGISKDAWKRYTSEGSWYYEILHPGYKNNLTDIASAIGIHQLRKCDSFLRRRQRIADIYTEAFSGIEEIQPPLVEQGNQHAWHLYIIQLNLEKLTIDRAQFIEEMRVRNIGTSVHFIPLHMHPYYRLTYGYSPDDFPNASYIYQQIVSLPIYSKMTNEDVNDVIDAVCDITGRYRKR